MSSDTARTDSPTWLFGLCIFIPFALGYFLSYTFRVANAVLAPGLVAEIHIGADELGLITAAYFLSFALFQIPLGILLDRYGPRRTEATLLLIAAVGAWVFANSDTTAGLATGRALIGLGVSACLMAAFKAFVLWFPARRLPLLNGLQMAAGGLGALSATVPLEWSLQFTDWRGVYATLGLASVVIAVILFLVVPRRHETSAREPWNSQLRGVAEVFSSRFFWRIAPWTLFAQAGFLAIQGLWAGPWLRDVAGLDPTSVANHLAIVAIAMVAGFVFFGVLAERLHRIGIPTMRVASGGMLLFIFVQAGIVMAWKGQVLTLWALFGFCAGASILPYAALSQTVRSQLAGRANTGLNLLVFVAAFALQWMIGVVIEMWPSTELSTNNTGPYSLAFGGVLALQCLGALWYVLTRNWVQRGSSP